MRKLSLILWLAVTVAISGYLSYVLFFAQDKSEFIVGEATHGHYQIEMACETCHTSPFGGSEVLQTACLSCHNEELVVADDSHPIKKFTDPRNADRLAQLNAAECVTCHREHQNEQTHAIGVTLPDDFCFQCHQEIAKDRPSHEGMGFDTCASAGCHNYHDNKALYEDFLVKHANQQEPLSEIKLFVANRVTQYQEENPKVKVLTSSDADSPKNMVNEKTQQLTEHWQASSHAAVGVNCTDCHNDAQNQWQEQPPLTMCANCHQENWQQFTQSHHGMRLSSALSQPLSPMTPAQGRLPFKSDSLNKIVSCESCHSSHELDLTFASTAACLSCHDDEHSNNFKNSKHFNKSLRQTSGSPLDDADVTCATCHLPNYVKGGVTRVMHNPNDNLRPNEKMIRTACLNCHSLEFSIDALADPALVKSNFIGKPSNHISSIDMAIKRIKK